MANIAFIAQVLGLFCVGWYKGILQAKGKSLAKYFLCYLLFTTGLNWSSHLDAPSTNLLFVLEFVWGGAICWVFVSLTEVIGKKVN